MFGHVVKRPSLDGGTGVGKCSRTRKWVAATALLAASAFGAASAEAGTFYSSVHAPPGGEASHEQILERYYGGDFGQTPVGGSAGGFSNGQITATRLADLSDDGTVESDGLWSGRVVSASAVASFARLPQAFGYYGGGSGGGYTNLFTVSGDGYDVTGSAGPFDAPAGSLRFGRSDGAAGRGGVSSNPNDNPGLQDHLVSYRIDGLADNGADTYLLFWEDRGGNGSDRDFNDLVVAVNVVEPLLIPLPAAAWSGLTGLAGLGLIAGVRKVRRGLR